MANGQNLQMLRQIESLFTAGVVGSLTDGQLLERFATAKGEAAEQAFATIVERHGPMVFQVCLVILRDSNEAHDAFQASFLILLKKAATIRNRDSLASWLHGVAHRVASCARITAVRRRRIEQRSARSAISVSTVDDRSETLHDELRRLPENYLAPIVLCHLEGLTHEQAARQLDWPIGTLRSRLARGRERLKINLTRRGLAPALVVSGIAVVDARLSASLFDSTVRMATRHVPASVAALAGDVARISMLKHMKVVAATIMVTGVLVTGVVVAQSGGSTRKAEVSSPQKPDRTILLPRTDPPLSLMLETKIDLDFPKPTRLTEVIKFIKWASVGPNDHGLAIYVDPIGLKDVGVSLDSHVTLVMKQVTIKKALEETLAQVGLSYYVKEGLLFISSRMAGLENRLDRIEQKLDGVLKVLEDLKHEPRH